MTEEELEQLPPQGHVKIIYQGPVSPHWEVHGVFGDGRLIDEFRQRAIARLQLLPPHDPQFRLNLVNFLIDLGRTDEAQAELDLLRRQVRFGRIEGAITEAEQRLRAFRAQSSQAD